MTDRQPRYRYRGSVTPSAEVKRPVAVHRGPRAATDGANGNGAAGTATIDIFDVIDSYGGWWGISASEVDAALKQVGDVETLYVRLNSPGGEATEGVAIANLLRASRATVRVTVYGLAASAASMVAVAGDVVNMAPGSILMIHDAWDFVVGPADELRKTAGVLDTISDSYAGIYAAKAGGDAADWRAVMRQDKWYSADAAVEAKLADAVGIDPTIPDNLPPVEETDDAEATVIELDIEINPAARAAAHRFDLSLLPNAPAALVQPQTPAEPPETPTAEAKEADVMSDTLIQGLRERLGVCDESVDEAGLLAALDEALAEQTETAPAASATNDTELSVLRRELDSTQAQLRSLTEARQRDEANARNSEKQRVFAQAFARGAVHPVDHPERVQDEADYDAAPEVMTRVLAQRPTGSRFPVKASGHATDPDKPSASGDDGWFPQFSTPRVEA